MSNVLNDGRVLVAYMGEQEALSFFRRRCLFEGDPEEGGRKLYAKFSPVASKLPKSSTKVRVRSFEPRVLHYMEKVPMGRILSEAVRGLPWSFKKVEIDGLICIQKHINLSYVDMISRGCDFKKEENLVDICFTDRFLNRTSAVSQVTETEYKVSADGDDLMVLGAKSSYDEAEKTRTVSIEVGWGVPAVLIVKLGDRFYLQNGCHRVYALRARGITYVPAVLVEGETYANLGSPGQPGFFSESLTTSKTPPTFAAFFSDRLSAKVKMRPRHTMITVSAQVLKTPSEDAFSKRAKPTASVRKVGEAAVEDVDVISEGWNVYSLSDGNILKVRQLVKGVGRSKDGNGAAVMTAAQTPAIVSIIPEDLGTPGNRDFTIAELESSVAEPDVEFEALKEPVNEYLTENGLRFNFRLKLTKVSKTSKFDRDGVPIYLIKTESQIESV